MSQFMQRHFPKIHAINERYSKPKIIMSKPVKIALFFLRAYLVLLVALLLYKFITILSA
jgi:hypothetical protein